MVLVAVHMEKFTVHGRRAAKHGNRSHAVGQLQKEPNVKHAGRGEITMLPCTC